MLAIKAAIWAALLLAAVACGSEPAVPAAAEKPDTIAHGAWWFYHFTSLEDMVATSDLVVVGEVTAIERGRFSPDPDPTSRIGYRNVTLTISETLKGSTPGSTVVVEESAYFGDGISFEYHDMPWSQLGDVGVFFLKYVEGQPAGHFRQIHPDGRILTHYSGDDGKSRMYDGTVEMFSHTPLGDALAELVPASAAEHVRQAAATAVTEQVKPQQPLYEILSDLEPEDTTGTINNIGGSRFEPIAPDGPSTTADGGQEVAE